MLPIHSMFFLPPEQFCKPLALFSFRLSAARWLILSQICTTPSSAVYLDSVGRKCPLQRGSHLYERLIEYASFISRNILTTDIVLGVKKKESLENVAAMFGISLYSLMLRIFVKSARTSPRLVPEWRKLHLVSENSINKMNNNGVCYDFCIVVIVDCFNGCFSKHRSSLN
jgi:hypothetical protein